MFSLPHSLLHGLYCSCDIFLNGNKLRFVNEYNILVLLLLAVSMMIKSDNDIMRQMQSLYIRGNFLSRNFMYCSDHVKSIQLFLSFLFQYILQASIHLSYKKSSLNKVRVAYNNCFRMLFKLIL